jgi:import inner membrane translocase subunit TIM44
VYRAHSAWSAMFAETEMGEAIRELRKLDADFTMESFLVEMEEHIIPTVLGAFLRADKKALRPWLGEAAMNAVSASIDERRRAGKVMDANILAIQHVNVHAAKVVEKLGPLVVVQFMAQQIDCLYDAKTGAVAEGSDNRVAAVFYAFAMTRERDMDSGQALQWSIKEFAIVGSLPWT